jgi:hypothetical protein
MLSTGQKAKEEFSYLNFEGLALVIVNIKYGKETQSSQGWIMD